ncbi:LPS assembly lipoprotein LptE [Weeksellaceae bacterium KMM 9713]|uniref:LPS assembly lipoprotein LptE n=1 Tax=Profundicola chukchiensis TaxID=2961959 RepID=A0A9X4RWD9_9FLAO|nr:LptE family protein [Profundicola chukchiensis]MDG4946965.1 LPS assembly lipoprotein LptE [Profundicola chukchiensis]MDG4951455.1 LPS assembly lipoprotein LptE [Profundicola chukchiensis]
MNFRNFSLILLSLFLFISCYSFTGSSLDPRIKTIKIDKFPNYSAYQNPNYSQEFTNDLQLRFDQRTNLILSNDESAHIKIEGEIMDYYVAPAAIVSGEQAALNRLHIQIKVRYFNTIDDSKSFTRTFSDYEDFPNNQTLQQVESSLVPDINERLIDQIFTAVVADW